MMSSDDLQGEIMGAPRGGDIFAEKYRIERVLGRGGMGYVLAAHHLQLDQRVAIKMLLPERALHPETVERFLREGRAAVKIRSEHVGRVLDVASHGGTPYIVMEFLDGCDLAALVEHEGRLEREVAVDYVLQACEAIAEAHAARIVHRDLKPANLFLVRKPDGTPCVKVLDFGISKMSAPEGAEQLSMTKTSSLVGSPLYMSPEQLKSAKNVDERSDIWSIGVILFELLSGHPPFLAETLPELGALVLSGNVPDLRELVPEVPSGLAGAVRTCLYLDPAKRFPSVAELAFGLAPFGSPAAATSAERISRVLKNVARPHSSWSSQPARSDPTPDWVLGSTVEGTVTAATLDPPTRRPLWRWAAVGVVGVGVASGAWMGSRAFRKPAAPAAITAGPSSTPTSSETTPVVTPTASASASAPIVVLAPTAPRATAHAVRTPAASVPIASSAPAPSTAPAPSAASGFTNNRYE